MKNEQKHKVTKIQIHNIDSTIKAEVILATWYSQCKYALMNAFVHSFKH